MLSSQCRLFHLNTQQFDVPSCRQRNIVFELGDFCTGFLV